MDKDNSLMSTEPEIPLQEVAKMELTDSEINDLKTTEAAQEAKKRAEFVRLSEMEEDTLKNRFLTFRIGDEDYGIEIQYITEIVVMQKITEVPNTLPYIKGVINLRGKVIPVMDVRERFHLELREYDDRTCIVVVDVSDVAVGLIVDTVNEVIDIPESQIDPPPSTYSKIQSSNINGMGKAGKKVKILLNVQNVLNLN